MSTEKKTRKSLLKLGEDAVKDLKLPFQVKRERKELEKWILDYEEKVAVLEDEIMQAKSNPEKLDVDGILDKVDDLELAKRRLAQGQELLDEMFD